MADLPDSNRSLSGQCMCRAVRYAVSDSFEYAMNCHCSNCRRVTGAACKPIAGIPIDRLRIVDGADNILRYGHASAEHDVHCATCGSFLYAIVRDGQYAHIAMGTLVDSPSIRPSMHIFVGSKAEWHEITDALPQFEAFPTD